MTNLNWGILGSGWIAQEMGEALQTVNGSIYGVYSANPAHAQRYAATYSVAHCYKSAEEMLADPNIDIIYIATPHNLHYQFIRQALLAGKHVFCEKSITVNASQLQECAALAAEKNLVICDGVTLFHMPLYKELKKRIASGAIGQVKMVQVNFGSCKEYDVNNRFFSKELAGGALLDIGVYAVSFARYFMGSKANVVLTTANYFETGVDETSGILLKNPDGEMAVISLTMRAKQPKRGVLSFDRCYIQVDEYPRADSARIVWTEDGSVEEVAAGEEAYALCYEMADLERAVAGDEDARTLIGYAADVMDLMTSLRAAWGVVYPEERQA